MSNGGFLELRVELRAHGVLGNELDGFAQVIAKNLWARNLDAGCSLILLDAQ